MDLSCIHNFQNTDDPPEFHLPFSKEWIMDQNSIYHFQNNGRWNGVSFNISIISDNRPEFYFQFLK